MGRERLVSQKRLGTIYLIAAIVFAALGGIVKALCDPGKVYDLATILWIFAGIVVIVGIQKLLTRRGEGMVSFSNEKIRTFLTNNAIMLALIVIVIVIAAYMPKFVQVRVVLDIFAQASVKLIVALGICFTLLIAGTDLSAGRMVGLAAVVATSMMQTADYPRRFYPDLPMLPIILPIIIALIVCMVFGVLNGFLVARFEMHPFIATLATQVIVYGANSLYFDMKPNSSQPIGGVRPDYSAIGQTKLLASSDPGGFVGISILIPIAIVATVIIWFVLNKTVFGKNVYAIGGNREAAIVSGVNVFATTMGIFILAAFMYGLGGVLESAKSAGATNNYGNGYELDAIAACVVGGVSLSGGIGKISGIVAGSLIFTVITYGLQFLNVSPMWQQIIKGVIIAIAVAIDMSKYRRK